MPSHLDRKSTRLNSSHTIISYAVFCLKKKKNITKRRERAGTGGQTRHIETLARHRCLCAEVLLLFLNCVAYSHPPSSFFFFFNDTATTEIYTLSLHDALPISSSPARRTSPARVMPQNLMRVR